MKRFFGFLLFVVGVALFVLTVTAFFVMGFQLILVASVMIAVFLLVSGFLLAYEREEELSQEELDDYQKNGSIGKRLGQL